MYQKSLLLLLIFNFSLIFARVPPRNIEVEENTELKSKNEPRIEEFPKVQEFQNGDQSKLNKKPFSLLVLRQPSMIFPPMRPMSPFSPMYHESMHNDPALRLISVLFGGHRLKPEPELVGSDESDVSIESIDQSKRDHFNPFESIFPSIFSNLKPIEKEDTPKELDSDSKTPENFEKKEKKVIIGHDGKKYVKSTQVKKVKNDFGMFHSVISSYQPWDEKIHDEDGNEKVKQVEAEEKPIESSTRKVDESKVASSTISPKLEVEEEPKSVSPKTDNNTLKKTSPEKLSERNDSKNEISDKKIDEKIEPTVEVNPK